MGEVPAPVRQNFAVAADLREGPQRAVLLDPSELADHALGPARRSFARMGYIGISFSLYMGYIVFQFFYHPGI